MPLPAQQEHAASQDFQAEKQELEWVLAHPEINRSANLVRFLSFICDKYFAGEAHDIREYSIAVHALGRKPSNFNSHDDPIVRVTARTLRKKLVMLYQGDGRDRPLRIALPLGHYVPQFVSSPEADAAFTQEVASVEFIDPPHIQGDGLHPMPAQLQPAHIQGDGLHPMPVQLQPAVMGEAHWRAAWKPAALLLLVVLIFLAGYFFGKRADSQALAVRESLNWSDPVWSDEFDGAAHQLPDPAKWIYDLESQSGVREREVYCTPGAGSPRECDPQHPNAFQDGAGHLVLRAQKNADGVWTLAKLTTKGVKSFLYGRVEARMRLPVGAGLWSSFVMVGADKDAVGWPASGSMDIMENVALTPGANGLGPRMIRSTLHGPRYFGSNGLWHDFKLPNGARVDDAGFHTYGVIWSPGMVQFYVDDPANVYSVRDANQLPEGGTWVFDHPFYLLMDLAVGGDWAGDPDAGTQNPADMLVDYVRVYKIPKVPAPRMDWQSVRVRTGSSAASTVSLRAPTLAGRVHMTCSTDTPYASCSLATSVVNFSDTLSQEDTLTISTDSFTEKGRVLAPPGRYNVTITATTMSGDHSDLTVPFEVNGGD